MQAYQNFGREISMFSGWIAHLQNDRKVKAVVIPTIIFRKNKTLNACNYVFRYLMNMTYVVIF